MFGAHLLDTHFQNMTSAAESHDVSCRISYFVFHFCKLLLTCCLVKITCNQNIRDYCLIMTSEIITDVIINPSKIHVSASKNIADLDIWHGGTLLATHATLLATHATLLATHVTLLATHDILLATHDTPVATHGTLLTTHDFLLAMQHDKSTT